MSMPHAKSTFLILLGLLAFNSTAHASQYSDMVSALGPVGYWQLNGNTLDSTANAQTGTWTNGAPTYVNGPQPSSGFPGMDPANQSGDFNSSRFVQISNHAAYQFDSANPFSMVAWINAPTSVTDKFIFAKELNSGTFRGYYMILLNTDATRGKFMAIRQTTGSNFDILKTEVPAPISDGNWHMVVSTTMGGFGTSTMKLYVDGVPVTTTTAVSNTLNATMLNAAPLTIGARDTTGGVPFLGQIDEPALFGFTLSAAQVQQLYLAATVLSVPEPSTLALLGLGMVGLATKARWRRHGR